MRYLIVDTANTFFRARHSAIVQSDTWDKLGFAIHVTLGSVNKAWRDQKADHVVFCLEGRAGEKIITSRTKRIVLSLVRPSLNPSRKRIDYFGKRLITLKRSSQKRLIAQFFNIQNLKQMILLQDSYKQHPNDNHVIISSDTDFYQLLAPNVQQYNGVADELHTLEGILDKKGKLVIDKKTKEPKCIPDPQWILFEKCMRGDPTDNIFSAYPGVRTKGSKKQNWSH
jgi:hypothetical protein